MTHVTFFIGMAFGFIFSFLVFNTFTSAQEACASLRCFEAAGKEQCRWLCPGVEIKEKP